MLKTSLEKSIEITTIKTEKKSISVHCLSDLHADTLRNQQCVSDNCKVNEIDTNNYNIMIVPGDIGTELESLDRIFSILSTNYDAVCYCIGNHEAWRRGFFNVLFGFYYKITGLFRLKGEIFNS